MALTEIEYGALASSELMNNNFNYLDAKIGDVSEDVTSKVASINSNIATINNSISSLSGSVDESIEAVKKRISVIELSGLFIETYVNGTSWYREYFSDAEKTNRVWLEQGGVVTTSGQKDVVFPKEFTDTNYTLTLGAITTHYSGYVWFPTINSKSTTGAQIAGNWSGGGDSYAYFNWMACGK